MNIQAGPATKINKIKAIYGGNCYRYCRAFLVLLILDAKPVTIGDNIEAVSAITQSVIFTLTLDFIFRIFQLHVIIGTSFVHY
jgi:hypothetical protein